MKVILKEYVPKLGQKWDIKEVATGHARNFLFPRNLAEPATPALIKRAEEERGRLEIEANKRLAQIEDMITKLDGLQLHILAKADDSGTLFGSVGEKEIAAALAARDTSLADISFRVPKPIKELGEHNITLEFADGLEADLTVMIDRE